jgi:hypothetical protein
MPTPFASLIVSDPIPLPFDEGQWVKVRKLTGRQHEEAQASHRAGFAGGNTRQWSLIFRRSLESGATDPEVQKALADPLTGYDRYALAKAGLVAWSYDRPMDADAIDDLDDEAIDFVALEVLRLTKPGLFATNEADLAAQKKSG